LYKSDYIPLVNGDKRLTLNRLVAAYRYDSSGIHDYYNSAKLVVYGIDTDGEVKVGEFKLTTGTGYLAGKYVSSVSELFVYEKEYEHLRVQLVDETADFEGLEADLHGVITVSPLNFDKIIVGDPNTSGISITLITPILGEVVGNWVFVAPV